jgi:hypothetical protein
MAVQEGYDRRVVKEKLKPAAKNALMRGLVKSGIGSPL